MSEVKWIKISVDIFNDEKLQAIGTLPDGNMIQLVWIKLLCLAGKCNEGGLLMVTRELPYTDEMLAKRFDMEVGQVQRALDIFQRAEMIEVIENIYMVSNWAKYQSTQSLEEMKAKHRERQRNYVERKKQKLMEEKKKEDDETFRVEDEKYMNALMNLTKSDIEEFEEEGKIPSSITSIVVLGSDLRFRFKKLPEMTPSTGGYVFDDIQMQQIEKYDG
jgi:predicted phage replisome organizer